MNTYQSLLKVAGKVPALEEREPTEDYLKRVVLAVSSVSIPDYEAMPDDARQWFDEAADALSAGMRVPVPEGFDREEVLHPVAATPALIRRPGGSSYTPPAPKPMVSLPADTEPRPGEPVRDTIIKLLIKEPDLTVPQLQNRLADYHIQLGTEAVATQRGFAVSVLRLVKEAGWRPG
jgi:hypothetical protein